MKELGITHLLCVATSFRFPSDESFVFLHQPLADDGTTALCTILENCFEFLDRVKSIQGQTLVFCRQAQNRSPTVVIAYLMKSCGMNLRAAYSMVHSLRPEISPHASYFEQLQRLDQSLFGNVSLTEKERGGSVQGFIMEMWRTRTSL